MTDTLHGRLPEGPAPARRGLLGSTLRRDLADLNSQYLELALAPDADGDPRFDWSDSVRACLAGVDAATLGRLAAAPFALFELVPTSVRRPAPSARVEDGRTGTVSAAWQASCYSFAYQAVFLAQRLVDVDPLASRVTLGLSDELATCLGECRLPQLAELAGNPWTIRPRWRRHARFWDMLVAAARRGTPSALQWAHCVGLCLIDASDGAAATAAQSRRRARR
jgi:hypothetical protein